MKQSCVGVCGGGKGKYSNVRSSRMACGMKLFLSLAVLLHKLQNIFPEASSKKTPRWGWEGSAAMFTALIRQHFSFLGTFLDGRMQSPDDFSTLLTTFCGDLQSEAPQPPEQTGGQYAL